MLGGPDPTCRSFLIPPHRSPYPRVGRLLQPWLVWLVMNMEAVALWPPGTLLRGLVTGERRGGSIAC